MKTKEPRTIASAPSPGAAPAPTEIRKPRSYVACLREGMNFPLTHFGEIFRFLWPAALAVAVVDAVGKMLETAIVVRGPLPMLSARSWVEIGLLELVAFVAAVVVTSQVVYQQRHLAEQGRLPGGRPWPVLRQSLSPFFRTLLCALFSVVVLLGAAAFFLAGALSHQPLWHVGGLALLFLLLCLTPAMLHYLYSRDGLSVALRTPFWRYLGRTVAVLLLALLACGLALFVVALPYLLVSLIDMLVARQTALGDILVLPTAFPLLRGVAIFLYVFLGIFVNLLLSYPLLYHWGACSAIEQERRQAGQA